ncbi:MAG: FHA domain-containing protein [Planctomycetales bacterium]|nr:FHA domain-containing protein [Planctomycetales bacterium]
MAETKKQAATGGGESAGGVALTLAADVVQQAREIVGRRDRVQGLLAKAESNKGKVKDKIYARVKADYDAQLRAIGQEYSPVRDRILRDLKQIRAEERRLRARLDVVNEELEELRFRCEVGEFPKDELSQREKEKLVAVQDLNDKLGTISKTYELSKQLLGGDAESVLAGPAAGSPEEFAEEVSIDVGVHSGVLPGSRGGGKMADVTIEEASPATRGSGPRGETAHPSSDADLEALPEIPEAGSATAVAEPEDSFVPLGDQKTVQRDKGAPPVAAAPGRAWDGTIRLEDRAILTLKNESGDETFVLGSEPLTVGRNPKNDIVLLDKTISRQHAKFSKSSEGYVVEDISSGSGVLVNGRREKRFVLQSGDSIEMGEFRFVFEIQPKT